MQFVTYFTCVESLFSLRGEPRSFQFLPLYTGIILWVTVFGFCIMVHLWEMKFQVRLKKSVIWKTQPRSPNPHGYSNYPMFCTRVTISTTLAYITQPSKSFCQKEISLPFFSVVMLQHSDNEKYMPENMQSLQTEACWQLGRSKEEISNLSVGSSQRMRLNWR